VGRAWCLGSQSDERWGWRDAGEDGDRREAAGRHRVDDEGYERAKHEEIEDGERDDDGQPRL
jgi:hypothetical protein